MHKNMHYKNLIIDIFAVTFRKEGVDWNQRYQFTASTQITSPSVRKVWIEIYLLLPVKTLSAVTFRKEGVDWNHLAESIDQQTAGHLP